MYGKFVEKLSNKNDKYGFVNEHEIRISTGITLVLAIFSLFLVLFKANYQIPLVFVSIIWLDFLLKVFISPNYSIFGNIVKLFIKKRDAFWVGAVQKRFAWGIGFFISTFVILCLLILGRYMNTGSPEVELLLQKTLINIQNGKLIVTPMNPAILACLICIVFMWLESVAGYCVGCSIYVWLVKKGIIKKYEGQNCVNGECKL